MDVRAKVFIQGTSEQLAALRVEGLADACTVDPSARDALTAALRDYVGCYGRLARSELDLIGTEVGERIGEGGYRVYVEADRLLGYLRYGDEGRPPAFGTARTFGAAPATETQPTETQPTGDYVRRLHAEIDGQLAALLRPALGYVARLGG